MTGTATIPFNNKLAKAVVVRVHLQTRAMLKESTLVRREWESKDESFGLFEKTELKLGKLLGSGGFSDVHEICSFTNTGDSPTKTSWNDHQTIARKVYKNNAVDKTGTAKYVVKHLKVKLLQNPDKFSLAASDLVVEAQLLSSLNHENILKIRGWAAGGINSYIDGGHDSYFLILDRLEETLDMRIEKWKMENETFNRLSLNNEQGSSTNDLLSRAKVAHQIASGLQYLHSKNLVFRDLKPNNVGFDRFGTVKIFDFGLARELPEKCDNINDVYKMSGRIGTLRYMAPECAFGQPYNQKVDTYSWAHLFWSCLALNKPYANMSRTGYLTNVCKLGERPDLEKSWPKTIRNLLKKSWSHDPYIRITMLEVCAYLERIEKELSQPDDVDALSEATTHISSSFTSPPILRRMNSTLSSPFLQQTRCLAQ